MRSGCQVEALYLCANSTIEEVQQSGDNFRPATPGRISGTHTHTFDIFDYGPLTFMSIYSIIIAVYGIHENTESIHLPEEKVLLSIRSKVDGKDVAD